VKIRRVRIEDLGKLQQLFRDSILKSGREHYTEAQLQEWSRRSDNEARWTSLIQEQFTILLESENQIIAFASLKDSDYFDFLYVNNDEQGKGYAKQLYMAILAEAKKCGATKLFSDVSYMARPFFEARGFNVLHENENKLGMETLVNFRVEKEI